MGWQVRSLLLALVLAGAVGSHYLSRDQLPAEEQAKPEPRTATVPVHASSPSLQVNRGVDSEITAHAKGGESELFSGNSILSEIQLNRRAFKKIFVFPDDHAVEIAFDSARVTRSTPGEAPDAHAEAEFAHLAEAAQLGSGSAASRLVELVDFCQHQPRTEAALEDAIRTVTDGTITPPVSAPAEETVQWLRQNYQRCKGIGQVETERALHLLRSTADEGDAISAWQFAARIRNTDPAIAIQYYERAWREGVAAGAFGVADVLRNKESPSYDDNVKAYGYYYAAYAVRLALHDGLADVSHREERENLIRRMEEFRAGMSPSVAADGLELAKQLIASRSASFAPL